MSRGRFGPLRFPLELLLSPSRHHVSGIVGGNRSERPARGVPVADPWALGRDWIPIVAQAGLTVITRDRRIAGRPSEFEAVKTHGLKLVVVTMTPRPVTTKTSSTTTFQFAAFFGLTYKNYANRCCDEFRGARSST